MNTRLKSVIFLTMVCSSLLLLAISCKKESDEPETVTDIDGNVYKTVVIGTQTWLAENLKTTRYNNGDIIGTTNPATLDIRGETDPKYQWAYDANESNVATYGRLYTWYAAADSRNICPTGWHVPSLQEINTLIINAGGRDFAGGKLKELGTAHWEAPNMGASDDFLFTALPGGNKVPLGDFWGLGKYGFWWLGEGNSMSMSASTTVASTAPDPYRYRGYSVRCVKN